MRYYFSPNLIAIAAMCSAAISMSQEFPAVRDPWKWPFARNSIWNMPIGSNARYVFANIQHAENFHIDENILIGRPEAPIVEVFQNTARWDQSKTRCGSMTSTILAHWPIPDDFNTEEIFYGPTPNGSAACLMPDKKTIEQGQPFHRCGVQGPATTGWLCQSYDIYEGSGIYGAHGGSNLSSIGGTIRVGELVPGGVIRHAMQISVWSAENYSRGGRWPCSISDGAQGGSVAAMKMGSLCALLPDFGIDALLTEPGKIVARAFMDYGAYTVDDAAWDAYYLNTEWGPDGRVVDEFLQAWGYTFNTRTDGGDWGRDMLTIFSNLHVVDNNSATNIGGGGTPRAPLAPEFGSIVGVGYKAHAFVPLQSLRGTFDGAGNIVIVGAAKRLYGGCGLVSADGKELLRGVAQGNTVRLDARGLPCGIYLLIIEHEAANRVIRLVKAL